VRDRWLSARALLLHTAVLVVACGCMAAAWWQATRALGGNGLSWFYSIEWPAFAVIAVVVWWHLIHEDPDVRRDRRSRPLVQGPAGERSPTPGGEGQELRVDAVTARLALTLAIVVGVESALGIVAVVVVPYGRPDSWIPARGGAIYLAHALLGVPLAVGAVSLLARVRRSSRLPRLTGWIGVSGIAFAGMGGLLTVAHPSRLAGMALMLVGAVVAAFAYLIPTLEKLS